MMIRRRRGELADGFVGVGVGLVAGEGRCVMECTIRLANLSIVLVYHTYCVILMFCIYADRMKLRIQNQVVL